MKRFIVILGIIYICFIGCVETDQVDVVEEKSIPDELKYLGMNASQEAQSFAEDLMLLKYEAQNCLTISKDLKNIYYGVYNHDLSINQVYRVTFEVDWSDPILFDPFNDKSVSIDAPFHSPDGKRLYFLARYPLDESNEYHETLYYLEDSQLVKLDIFDEYGLHMQFSVADDYSLYFKSKHEDGLGESDIWFSPYEDGEYLKPLSLSNSVNTEANEMTPYISPDQSYLLFSRNKHSDGFGGADLYISFKDDRGQWQEATNLGDKINSYGHETCPIISPDGQYLFFNSSKSSRFIVYWMSLEGIGLIDHR